MFHFVSYVPHNGQLYELDGLQKGPIGLGAVTEDNWLKKAKEEIQKRIEKYSAKEIRFNLLAIIDDKKIKAEKEAARLTSLKNMMKSRLDSGKAGQDLTADELNKLDANIKDEAMALGSLDAEELGDALANNTELISAQQAIVAQEAEQ